LTTAAVAHSLRRVADSIACQSNNQEKTMTDDEIKKLSNEELDKLIFEKMVRHTLGRRFFSPASLLADAILAFTCKMEDGWKETEVRSFEDFANDLPERLVIKWECRMRKSGSGSVYTVADTEARARSEASMMAEERDREVGSQAQRWRRWSTNQPVSQTS
jgi:hypothetical protein